MGYFLIAVTAPWIAAMLWVAQRGGWRILWSTGDDEALPSQASRLRGFSPTS
jgi:hypothetical protein